MDNKKTKAKMFNKFAHDFKSPLTTISGSLEVLGLMNDRLSDEKRDALIKSALSSSKKLEQNIAKVTEFIKIEEGLVEYNYTDSEIKNLINSAIYKAQILNKNASFKINGDNFIIHTDTRILTRILELILENAIIHGTEAPNIIINFSKNDVEIIDNGLGIEEINKELVFNKFYRINDCEKSNIGTGLGLYIAKKYADLIGYNLIIEANNKFKISFS